MGANIRAIRSAKNRLSITETLAGKELLVTGVTGFLGKVWLAELSSPMSPQLDTCTSRFVPRRRPARSSASSKPLSVHRPSLRSARPRQRL